MRTIRRVSLPLNQTKWNDLREMARCFRAEKNAHLPHYHHDAHFAADDSERTHRDELVAAHYANPNGLQGRMWKMAQKDAYETVEKQWAALREELSPLIQRHEGWSDTARHYAHWLVFTPQRMAELVSGRTPVPTQFMVSLADQRQVRNYLRRVIRRKRGSRPVARKARSIAFDADMYKVFEHGERQYIALMSQTPGKRIVVPLTGNTPIVGNIRVVLDFHRHRVQVHYTAEINAAAPQERTETVVPLDGGVSEVFTDEQGTRYAREFGQVIARASDEMHAKGKKRNKLYQLGQRRVKPTYAQSLDPGYVPPLTPKAKRVRKFNLGRAKQRTHQCRQHQELERQINTAINQVVAKRKPALVVMEKLDLRGKAKSRKMSRRVSLWTRGILKERLEFKASAECFRREQVNPAYTSQTCPACGFVHPDNRHGDAFQCLHCGYTDAADRVAAINLKARWFDPDIHLYTPKGRVKEILLARFNAHLPLPVAGALAAGSCLLPQVEREGSAPADPTVSGRTPGDLHLRSRRRAKRPSAISLGEGKRRCEMGQHPNHV